jgi:hypothetical protein
MLLFTHAETHWHAHTKRQKNQLIAAEDEDEDLIGIRV